MIARILQALAAEHWRRDPTRTAAHTMVQRHALKVSGQCVFKNKKQHSFCYRHYVRGRESPSDLQVPFDCSGRTAVKCSSMESFGRGDAMNAVEDYSFHFDTDDRRKFLAAFGRSPFVTPPHTALLLSVCVTPCVITHVGKAPLPNQKNCSPARRVTRAGNFGYL